MKIEINKNAQELGISAAKKAAEIIRDAVENNGIARIVVSTGSSQFETLEALLKDKIEWGKVEIFHLDEYIGIPITHKASFRNYLNERFIIHVHCKKFYAVDTEGDINKTISYLSDEITKRPIDLGIIGIGVNGHIAFNDPPANFETRNPYIVVSLDEKCKKQQADEGWFNSIADVPDKAVSMSVWQIMQCKTIVTAVPHQVKADAIYKTLTGKLSPLVPATILKQHPDFNLFLDSNSASRIITL
ncbi:MAG: 6-phosphogluconolactonase [Prolixibacteraceae bacterium]|nr:6-phosphogluconolactonase [Prolixibacteraceae bacterium]